jgi:hypothetical protein
MAKKRQKDQLKEFMIQQIAREAANESVDLLRHICAIYRADQNGEPEQFGSGVFLAVGSRHFMLTAAHVLDDNAHSTLYIPSTKTLKLVELKGDSFCSKAVDGDRERDRTDIGVVLLSPDLVDHIGPDAFATVPMVDVDDIGTAGGSYIAMGYPWRKNAKLNRAKRTVKGRPLSYTANILPPEKLKSLGVHQGSHLLLEFDKRHSRDETGRDVTAPDPEGMSGGALWRFDVFGDEPLTSRLVGIVIEWRDELGGILTVRLPVILAGIAHEYPDLAYLVPATFTLGVTVHMATDET